MRRANGLSNQSEVVRRFKEVLLVVHGGENDCAPCPPRPRFLSSGRGQGRMRVLLLLACQEAARTENRENERK